MPKRLCIQESQWYVCRDSKGGLRSYTGLGMLPTYMGPFHVCVETPGRCTSALQAPQGAGLLHLAGQFLLQAPAFFSCRVAQHGNGRVCMCLAAACVCKCRSLKQDQLPEVQAIKQRDHSGKFVIGRSTYLASLNLPKTASGLTRLLRIVFKEGGP